LTVHNSNFPRIQYKPDKFSCDRSINKDILLGGHRTFSSVPRLALLGFKRNFILRTIHICATNDLSLVAVSLLLRALQLENKATFCLYLGFHWSDYPTRSFVSPGTRALQKMQFFALLKKLRDLYLGNKLSFPQCLGFHWRDFPETSCLALHMYALRRFGFNWPIIKGSLRGEQGNFSALYPIPLERFNWKFIARTFHACAISGVSSVEAGQ
jgi:hypothetical protein